MSIIASQLQLSSKSGICLPPAQYRYELIKYHSTESSFRGGTVGLPYSCLHVDM